MTDEGLASLGLVASRLAWYAGCLTAIGASAFRIVASRTGRPEALALTGPAGRVGFVAAVAALAATGARLYAQTYSIFAVEEPVTLDLLRVVAADLPPWSRGWQLQALAAAVAAFALWFAGSGRSRAWLAAHAAGLALAVTMPLTGHAAAQPDRFALPLALQAGHVLGAGVWLGGLFVLLLVTGERAGENATARAPVALLVQSFSPVALAAAALLTLSGAGTTLLYFPTLPDVVETEYGRALLWKLALFAGVAALGFVNWRYMRPRLLAGGGARLLRRTAALELTFAALVLAATAVLTGLPQPAEESPAGAHPGPPIRGARG